MSGKGCPLSTVYLRRSKEQDSDTENAEQRDEQLVLRYAAEQQQQEQRESGDSLLRIHQAGYCKFIESMYEYITIDDVYGGYRDCKRFKADTVGCVEYMQNYLANNLQLYRDLNSMAYEIGQSKAFCVTRPKLREVFCAQFRDRVVHHILAIKFMDIFEAEMLDCAYACRKGKGTLYGIEHVRQQIIDVSREYTVETWILKCDL